MKLSFLSLALFATMVSAALSCSCAPTTFEENYCRSKTSVRVKVLARTDNCVGTCDPINDQINGQIIYILKVINLFKGVKIEDDVMYAKTAVNGGLCGVTLDVGEEYLLNVDGPFISRSQCPTTSYDVGLCNFPELWNGLSKAQKRFVIVNSRTDDSLCRK